MSRGSIDQLPAAGERQEPPSRPAREARAADDFRARYPWAVPVLLFALTVASTTYIGGLGYSLPVMAILLCHEFGHYIAAKIHRVPASLPHFIPLPIWPLGTMGAVILMPERIRKKNALLDIGAAGPLAGMVIAVPVLIYGIIESPVAPQSTEVYAMEGRSLLYLALLYGLKGPIPAGYDIHLSETALAGWVGLFVTMLNLIPVGQLDGGHIAHALFGDRHEKLSKAFRWSLLGVALLVALFYAWPALVGGKSALAIFSGLQPGVNWLVWFALLSLLRRATGREHPETDAEPLSRRRRVLGLCTLGLFVLLFMPAWLRTVDPSL